jgi:glycosyltransferase involved in cell wall biosynthesis
MSSVAHMIGHLRLGAGKHILETALEQHRRGWKVEVLVSPDIDANWRTDPGMLEELLDHGIGFDCPGNFFSRDLAGLLSAAEALRQRWGDHSRMPIIHAHSAIPAAVGRWSGARRVIATCHGMAPERDSAFKLQDALAYRSADSVISPSSYWAQIIQRDYGVPNVAVVPYGLDLKKYPVFPVGVQKQGVPYRILVLCELTRRKGVDLLLDAVPQVIQCVEKAEFHIFGSGDAEEALKKQACELSEGGDRVFFHGRVEWPYPHFPDFDLLCLPTRSDNMPLAIMEAMLAGLPVLSTRVGGIPEIVEKSGCGVLAAPDCASNLADKMIRILNLGRAELLDKGKKGFDWARQRFDVSSCVDSLESLYCGEDSAVENPGDCDLQRHIS